MSRQPLAPDLWEQALLNGRRINPSNDAEALAWAQRWYEARGGGFRQSVVMPLEPVPAPEPAPLEPAVVEPAVEPRPSTEVTLPPLPTAVKPARRWRSSSSKPAKALTDDIA